MDVGVLVVGAVAGVSWCRCYGVRKVAAWAMQEPDVGMAMACVR